MNEEKFNQRLVVYLPIFKNLFKSGRSKRKLKESIYNSPKLNEEQKDIFWEKIVGE